ncbi:MAG: toprim domain-containing protein [Lentisphaeria bacterium]|nr:toprim domain-containing protein [Lentisphaeria bacterium]
MRTGIIEKIKDSITVPAYMQREYGRTAIGNRMRSFRPDAKNNSSLLVNERDWFDFGSGIGGDVIDLAAHDKFNGNKGQAIKYLAESWNLAMPHDVPQFDIVFSSYLGILENAAEFYAASLTEQHTDYLHSRGLTDATIGELKIGWAENPCDYLKDKGYTQEQIADSGILQFYHRIMIPYLRNGKAVYMAGRASHWQDTLSSNPEAKYMKLFRSAMSEHPIWGFETLAKRSGTVIIAEGIFDAISCYQEGFPVVTAVTGSFSSEQKKDLLPALKGRDCIVCMDYDPETKAGQKFTEKLATELFENGIHVSAVFLDGGDKKSDLNEIYAAKPDKQTLINLFAKAQSWDKVQIGKIAELPSEQEKKAILSKFLRRCATVFDWPTVAQMVEEAKETDGFPRVWLNELAKTLKSAPKEVDVVKEFKEKFDCLYHEALGWHEYTGSIWTRRSEYEIRQYIGKLLGRFQTAKLVDSVRQLLRSELIYKKEFNINKKVLNFPNGELDIASGSLKNHARESFSTIQMNYSFDPQATCPTWEQFIEEITDGARDRSDLLQEMFGYCLTHDTRYQKCFYLIGDGANGKSVLLGILEALIGEANASHVEIAFLGSDFQRIKLANSMVNICNDIKTDVAGTGSFFKAIVTGDTISGCFKGKDFFDFKPTCKMVFAANSMLNTRDIDNGFLRRICFVNFPIKFVPEPTRKNERQRDPELQKKLLKELPGILNWSLAGLKALRENGSFTNTTDQETLIRELELINNPIAAFVEDIIAPEADWYATPQYREDIYKKYQQWCVQTNSAPMSSRWFWPRLRRQVTVKDVRRANSRHVIIELD